MEEAKDLQELESTFDCEAYLHVDAEKCWDAGHVYAFPHWPVVGTVRIARSPPFLRW